MLGGDLVKEIYYAHLSPVFSCQVINAALLVKNTHLQFPFKKIPGVNLIVSYSNMNICTVQHTNDCSGQQHLDNPHT